MIILLYKNEQTFNFTFHIHPTLHFMERLFDCIEQLTNKHPDNILLANKSNGIWHTLTVKEVHDQAKALAAGLIKIGIEVGNFDIDKQEKIGIVSPNRPEWLITDLAVQQAGAILTPIYPTIAPNEFAYILNQAGIKKVFFSDEALVAKFQEVFKEIPTLEHIYTFDDTTKYTNWRSIVGDTDSELKMFETIKQINTNHIATIIYTSGTTGQPKGVMLSHKNIISNIKDTEPVFHFAYPGAKALSFLPLNHIFERTITYIYMNAGLSIYYAENMDTIGDNLKEVKPIVFTCVPRLLEKVYEKIIAKGHALTGIKKALFFWAVGVANQFDNAKNQGFFYNLKLKIANKLIFSKWREALGGNVISIVSGAAALQPKLARIFTAAGITVMEGYGLTETSPVISVNLLESHGRRIGTVGPPLRNIEVKIAEDGEVLCKGPNIMVGYYKNEAQTRETIDAQGWFHTGDIGTMEEGRFLKITDRKKEIFKTSGGKYVAPQPIEGKLRESPFIEQALIIGPERKFVAALIVPNYDNIKKFLATQGVQVPADRIAFIQHSAVIALVQKEIDHFNPSFSHIEQIKKFVLLPYEWSVDNGLLTPKLSMRRKIITDRFAQEIETLYV